jgi:hypothetical protein
VKYTYAIERKAAEAAFAWTARERRLLQVALEQIADAPFHPGDFQESGVEGRTLFTRFFGPIAVTYWVDHAVAEVRIADIFRD